MVKKAQYGVVAALGAVALMAAQPAYALRDPLIEGARQCTQYFPVEEKKNSIPTHLLAAIATTESGRWHDGLGMSVPWPWTINVEGKGYYFNSKAEAIAQVQALMAKGFQSIDVGCMQVNLKHHPRAFTDLNQAFDPAKNVAYAATFLRDNYASLGDWIKATAAYHSRTPHHGQRYLGEIERSWNRIVAKVASARAGKGGGEVKVARSAAPMATTASATTATASAAPTPAPMMIETKPRVIENNATPAIQARRARVIQVRDELSPKNAPVVVRTPTADAPVIKVADAPIAKVTEAAPEVKVAAAVPVASVVETLPASNTVRRVNLDNGSGSPLAAPTASGPKFVFAN